MFAIPLRLQSGVLGDAGLRQCLRLSGVVAESAISISGTAQDETSAKGRRNASKPAEARMRAHRVGVMSIAQKVGEYCEKLENRKKSEDLVALVRAKAREPQDFRTWAYRIVDRYLDGDYRYEHGIKCACEVLGYDRKQLDEIRKRG